MILIHFYLAITQLPFLAYSFNLFKSLPKEQTQQNDVTPAVADFDPRQLLESRAQKPEIYTKAMLELKRLEEEPICHRIAVQLLMKNCEGLENVGESDHQLATAHLQRHHVESFAAGLAICDLERGGFVISSACLPFTSVALMQASHDNKGHFKVTEDQVGSCLGALGQDHSHWMTWLSYRDKALLFCRAARLDIDKDQAILHHKKLTQIMEEFTNGLDEDLNYLKQNMAENTRIVESYFEGLKIQVEQLKAKFRGSIDVISVDIREAASSVKATVGSTKDLQRVIKTMVETVLQSNAEMAAGHERSLVVTTTQAKSQMEHLNMAAGEVGETIAELKESLDLLFPAIVSLGERQNALDERAHGLNTAMANMTTLLSSHKENLEYASSTALTIHHSLEKAAFAAQSWNETIGLTSSVIDYAIRISAPISSVYLGSHGLPPSLTRNLILGGAGYGMAESVVYYRHSALRWCSWTWLWAPIPFPINHQRYFQPTPSNHLNSSNIASAPEDTGNTCEELE